MIHSLWHRFRYSIFFFAILYLLPPSVWASKPRLRLERIDVSQCSPKGLINAYLSELELEGQLRIYPPADYRLVVNGDNQNTPPIQSTTFANTNQGLRIAFIIQNAPSYARDLPLIKKHIQKFFDTLPVNARISIIVYASEARRIISQGNLRQVTIAMDHLNEEPEEMDLFLDRAILMGIHELREPRPDERRLLILISDGINHLPKRDIFRQLGDRARQEHIIIHPVGYSPIDERGPLLNLGEIAKRSGGTMRWATHAAQIGAELDNLGREIREQMVLTFEFHQQCAPTLRWQIKRAELLSNAIIVSTINPAASPSSTITMPRGTFFLVGVFILALSALVILTRSIWLIPRKSTPSQSPKARPATKIKKNFRRRQ